MSKDTYGTPKKARRIRELIKSGVIPASFVGGLLSIRRSRLRQAINDALANGTSRQEVA
jgi:hypothetical protein